MKEYQVLLSLFSQVLTDGILYGCVLLACFSKWTHFHWTMHKFHACTCWYNNGIIHTNNPWFYINNEQISAFRWGLIYRSIYLCVVWSIYQLLRNFSNKLKKVMLILLVLLYSIITCFYHISVLHLSRHICLPHGLFSCVRLTWAAVITFSNSLLCTVYPYFCVYFCV